MSEEENAPASKKDGNIPIASSADLCKITVEMAELCRHRLDIVSRSLEPMVYDSQGFLDAVKKLTVTNRGSVRIIVLDPSTLISRSGHRLIEMALRLSSYMEIRRPGEHHAGFNEAMLIADRLMVVHRKYSDRYEGMANFHAPRLAYSLTENFEAIWQNAETIPDFRRLML